MDWHGETWFIYTAQSCTEKQFLLEKTNQYARDLSLFHLFLMGLLDTSNGNTYKFIAQNLKEFSGALFVSVSEYNRESRHYEGELLGTSLFGMQVGTLDPSIEMLQAFRYAFSLFLHVRRIQQKI